MATYGDDFLAPALKCVREDYSSLPDGNDLIAKIHKKFYSYYENPRREELSSLCRSSMDENEARMLLFCPSPSQIRFYPALFERKFGSEKEMSDLQLAVLSLMYIVHRKKWSFLRDFIIAGGLDILSAMTVDNNLYTRGQIVEIFLSITDCDTFDWFIPQDCDQVRTALYLRMVSLHDSPLLTNLMLNRDNSYPGGSMRCLQLMAFWLSWVRFHFSNQTGVLRLSPALLEGLRQWEEKRATTSPESEVENAEKQLASTLVQDFGSVRPAEGGAEGQIFIQGCVVPQHDEKEMFCIPAHILAADDARIAAQVSGGEAEGYDVSDPHDGECGLDPSSPREVFFKYISWSPLEIKNKGNEFFNEGRFVAAAQCYLHALLDLSDSDSLTSLEATLNYNIASVLWKLSALSDVDLTVALDNANTGHEDIYSPTLGQLKEWVVAKDVALLQCTVFCEKCLSLCGNGHKKALYRLCSALVELNRASEAISRLDSFFRDYQQPRESACAMNDDIAALQELRRKCIARVFLGGDKPGVRRTSPCEGDDTHQNEQILSSGLENIVGGATSKIFSQLQARQTRLRNAISHPWDGVYRDDDNAAQDSSSESLADHNTLAELNLAESCASLHDLPQACPNSAKAKKQKGSSGCSKKKLAAAVTEEKRKKCLKLGIKIRKESLQLRNQWIITQPTVECISCQQAIAMIIKRVWKDGYHLADIFESISLDEDILLCILMLLNDSSSVKDIDKEKIKSDLFESPRFDTTLRLLKMCEDPSSALKVSLHETMALLII